MASSIATIAAALVSPASSKSSPSSSSTLLPFHRHSHSQSHLLHYYYYSNLSFPSSPFPHSLQLSSKVLRNASDHSCVVRAQQNEVGFPQWFSLEDLFSNIRSFVDTFLEPSVAYKVDKNDDGESSIAFTKSEVYGTEAGDSKPPSTDPSPSSSPSPASPADDNASSEESISEFIAQVANLVKLVDSRDIVELQLKQNDCKIVIRKKEALPQPPSAPPQPHVMMQPPPPPPASMAPPAEQPSQPVSESAPSLPAPKSSNLPPLKCPMAGTFYPCPAPGEPPFVKVGDKVKKGQVLCIIEAMKLMNEIEADQSGTIIEVLAEDGKPVSVDTPLFVIEP